MRCYKGMCEEDVSEDGGVTYSSGQRVEAWESGVFMVGGNDEAMSVPDRTHKTAWIM